MDSVFGGIEIIPDPSLVEHKQIRFPRTKNRRIRKKWRKRPGNWATVPKAEFFKMKLPAVMWGGPFLPQSGEVSRWSESEMGQAFREVYVAHPHLIAKLDRRIGNGLNQ